jgi:glycosyltransferase involved in cell wall biosynthesis
MAAGLAVVASDAAAVQEVADGAALIVPANASEQWARALGLVLSDAALAKELRRRSGEVAAKNTWARAADRTLEVLARADRGSTGDGAGHA